jgi:hypothetical protein
MATNPKTKLMQVMIVRYESQDPITKTKYSYASETVTIEAVSPKQAVMQAIKRTSIAMLGAHVHHFVDGERVYFN